jgi:hypothetical protein
MARKGICPRRPGPDGGAPLRPAPPPGLICGITVMILELKYVEAARPRGDPGRKFGRRNSPNFAIPVAIPRASCYLFHQSAG